MFYSKWLLSSKGALWVAAYCFKRLKKSQVKEFDISPSVDKILQDEMNFDSYRVLAYLLLGVVRIYSKKVDYLLHDCNEVLIKIKKFTIDTENNANMETLRMSITLPDRFELDAFDLDILEDVGSGNIAPKEEITLKDVLWKDEGIGQFSLDKYQCEFDFCQNTCTADHLLLEDVQQSQLMDNDYEVNLLNSPTNLQSSKEKFQDRLFCQEESVNFDTIFGVKGVPAEPINSFIQNQQINEEQTVLETALYEDEIHEERSMEEIILCGISQEEPVDIGMFTRREEEPVGSITVSPEVGEEQIKAIKTADIECQMHQEIGEAHEAIISSASMERLQEDKCNKNEMMDGSSVAKEKIEKLIEGFVEKHYNAGKLKLLEKVSTEDGKFGEEQIKVRETANSACQMHQEIEEVHEARNSPVSTERLLDDISNKKYCTDPDRSSFAKEKIEKVIEESVAHDCDKGRLKLQEKVSVEDEKFHVLPPESKCFVITPRTMFPGDSVAKAKRGVYHGRCYYARVYTYFYASCERTCLLFKEKKMRF